ncbi:MAG: PAS domain-containing protein [Kiloniellaceae bacterium]
MTGFLYSHFYLADLGERDPPPVHPRFTDMIRYLESVAPDSRLPGRQHIDPCDLRHVLKLVNLVDVERAGGDLHFRYRLIGETQTLNAGRDITGMLVEEAIVPPLAARITGNMRQVLETRLPVYDRFPMPHPDRDFIDSQRMYYPLAADGEHINMFLILNGYDADRLATIRSTSNG